MKTPEFFYMMTTQLNLYAMQELQFSLFIMFIQFIVYYWLTHVNIVHSHIVIYALFVDDYIGKPWVFIMEPQRQHELEVSITLIAPVNW